MGRGGQLKFYPYKKRGGGGGGEKVAMLKGGTTEFEVVLHGSWED